MQNVFEFIESRGGDSKPWLIMGKGPTFAQRTEFDLKRFNVISLNHAVVHCQPLIAHVIDVDVIADCGNDILLNAEYLLMPWVPHTDGFAGQRDLAELAGSVGLLQELDRQGRLLWYDLDTSRQPPRGHAPIVSARHFSAEAVLHLLALAGIKTMRTLGVDGGTHYSREFADCEQVRLANGQSSFDVQMDELRSLKQEFALDFGSLAHGCPIRVFVGCSESEWLPFKVLEHSILRQSSQTVECFPLYKSTISIPQPSNAANRPRTAFSFQRFLIPEMVGFVGRAIYLDSDMQVCTDIARLWSLPFDDATALGVNCESPQHEASKFSVMLLDCGRLNWRIAEIVDKLNSGELDYRRLMHNLCIASAVSLTIPARWNSISPDPAADVALIHHTDTEQQPWLSRHGILHKQWIDELKLAIANGFLTLDDVALEISKGNIRPTLMHELISQGDPNELEYPAELVVADFDFVPPHLRKPQKAGLLQSIRSVFQRS